ncbi:hypothetical protein TorRG33x02_023840 [Trema orientale]|uniref:Uncharacterized protein n=1 Tax=Trema orientale TaxID=63057 RepID=A0A2P5FV27_TREOI|nr:hypothetical protein TorRG33x02_023840 [Trema orientale]
MAAMITKVYALVYVRGRWCSSLQLLTMISFLMYLKIPDH